MSEGVKIEIHEYGDGGLRNPPTLRPNCVHVWYRSLESDLGAEELADYRELLSDDELLRAQRYRVEKPRRDFIVARATLRDLLASYLGRSPGEIVFEYGARGKPSLRAPAGSGIEFNVSHTDGLAAFVVTIGRDVGIDVERIHTDFDAQKLAERFFSPAERDFLRGLAAQDFYRMFFRCWTCKEAYIKACGEGLAIPLDQFDVALADGQAAAITSTRPDPAEAEKWILHRLTVKSGYAAALAVASARVALEQVQGLTEGVRLRRSLKATKA